MTQSWSRMTRWLSECGERFGTVLDLPLRHPNDELRKLLRPDTRVLDIGAGAHRPMQKTWNLPRERYTTLDADPEGEFDFRSFDEMPATLLFDLIVANQVLEHLTVPEAQEIVEQAIRHLAVDGHFVATVPNAAHPVRQRDPNHITPWPMGHLYGLFREAGFAVPVLGRYNKFPFPRNPIKRFIVNVVCETFRVDWCDSLVIVGRKPNGDGPRVAQGLSPA